MIDVDTGLPALLKRSGESKLFYMNFAGLIGVDTINTVTNVTVTNRGLIEGSADVTVSETAHDSNKTVQFTLAGGTHLEDYIIEAIVTTANEASTVHGEGVLYVRDVRALL